MAHSKSYIYARLMELSFITDARPLEEIEQEEEKSGKQIVDGSISSYVLIHMVYGFFLLYR